MASGESRAENVMTISKSILNSQPPGSGKKILLFDPEDARMFIIMDISDKAIPQEVVSV